MRSDFQHADRGAIAAIHLLGITAYAVPWLSRVHGPARLPLAGAVFAMAVAFAAWTTRSRRPTLISVLGAVFTAGAIGLAPAILAAGRLDPAVLTTPRNAVAFAVALALGIVLARPAVRGRARDEAASLAAAERSGARAGAWLVLVAAPPLAFAASLFRTAPRSPEVIFALGVASAIVIFGFAVWLAKAARVRAVAHRPLPPRSRNSWPASVRHHEAT